MTTTEGVADCVICMAIPPPSSTPGLGQCRPMINKPPPFKGPNIGILIIIPIEGRGVTNQGSTLKTLGFMGSGFGLELGGLGIWGNPNTYN